MRRPSTRMRDAAGPRRARLGAARTTVLLSLCATGALLAGCGTTVPVSGGQASQLGQGLATQAPAARGSVASGSQGSSAGTVPGGSPQARASRASLAAGDVPATRASTGPSAAVRIPDSGPGWDKTHVYVGVVTVTDAPTVGHALGINSLDYGDQNSYLKAIFDYVNRRGGLFGRQLVAVRYDVSSTTDPSTSGQAACAKFSQDQRVVAALGAVNTVTYFSCMKAAHIPVMTTGYGTLLPAKDLAQYEGWLYFWGNLSMERLVPVWLDRLRSQGYFHGWSNKDGTPSTAPVKVGLVYSSDDYRASAFAYLKRELQRRGYDVAAEFQAATPSDYSNAVIKFRTAGVTHLFLDPSAALFYPPQAQNQHYYARYAVTSDNYIQPFLQDTQPAAQLRGMMGVGWIPSQDVDLAHNPGPNAGQSACFTIMREAGASLAKDNYQYAAEDSCDTVFLFLEMAHRGGGLDPQSLLRGVKVAGTSFPWASQLGRGIGSTDLSLAPVVRGLEYVQSCTCVQYVGPQIRVP